jgi:hypothetical protein
MSLEPVLRPNRTAGDRIGTICAVMGWWAVLGNRGRGCIASTISGYMSRVYTFHREHGWPHPLLGCDVLRLTRTITGIERLGSQSEHARLALTAEIILELLASPSCDPNRAESAALRLSLVLGFYAMFRRGDMLSDTAASFDPRFDLCVGDLVVDTHEDEEALVVDLKCCKNDRAAVGQQVVIGPGAEGLCAVAESKWYQTRWRAGAAADAPLLVDRHGRALGFRKHAALLSGAISSVGRDPHAYTSHSLRIGGACAAAAAGIPEFLIQQLGRWRSLCFKVYLRKDRRLHAGAAARMAAARPRLPGSAGVDRRVCQIGRLGGR